MVGADARALPLLPQVGAAWRPPGTPEESMPPGTNDPSSLAGALPLATGTGLEWLGPRTNHGVWRALLPLLDHTDPAHQFTRIAGGVENSCLHQATAVEQWSASHPRWAFLWFPTSCPRATPIEWVFGAGHDTWTRHHTRKRLRDLVQDVEQH